jgi:hypothetical protein
MTTESILSTPAPVVETPVAAVAPVVETPVAAVEPVVAPVVETPVAEVKPAGAPEAYADFTVPAETTADPSIVTDVKALAKELNLPQDQAQKVFEATAKVAAKGISDQHAAIAAVHTTWDAESAKAGYTGETLAKAAAALKATSSPELMVLLEKSGLYRNPHVIAHFLQIAPAFAEGQHVPGGKAPAGDGKSTERVLYPNNA